MLYLSVYLILINAAAFIFMLADKRKAQKGAWRISESTLINLAIFGGSIGAIAGMKLFRHKTKHPKFYIGLPVILIIQLILAAGIIYYMNHHPFP